MNTILNLLGALNDAWATIIAAGIASLGFVYYERKKKQLEESKAFRELFNEFNKRFDDINEKLNTIRAFSLANENLFNGYKKTVQDYLNLCAEEYMWKTNKLIPVTVWNAWRIGINFYLEAQGIREIFHTELSGKSQKSYYGLHYELLGHIEELNRMEDLKKTNS